MRRRRTGFSTQHVSFVGRWSLWSLLWPAWWQISWAKLLLARGPILAGSPEDREQSMGPPSVMRLARLDISHILDTMLVPLSLEQHGYFSASFMQLQQGHSPDMQAQMHHKTCTVCRRHYTLPHDAVYKSIDLPQSHWSLEWKQNILSKNISQITGAMRTSRSNYFHVFLFSSLRLISITISNSQSTRVQLPVMKNKEKQKGILI